MAKVVFLDIDGVCHQVDDPRGPFRPKCMMQLKKLVHGSGAEDGRKMMALVTQRQLSPCPWEAHASQRDSCPPDATDTKIFITPHP